MENLLNIETPAREIKYQETPIEDMAAEYRNNNLTPIEDYSSSANIWSENNLNRAFTDDPLKLIPSQDIFRKAYANNPNGENEMRNIAKKAAVNAYYVKQFRLSPQIDFR